MSDAVSDDTKRALAAEALLAEERAKTAAEQEQRKAALSPIKFVSAKARESEKARAACLVAASETARATIVVARQANGLATTKVSKPYSPAAPEFEHRKNPSGLPVSFENTIRAISRLRHSMPIRHFSRQADGGRSRVRNQTW